MAVVPVELVETGDVAWVGCILVGINRSDAHQDTSLNYRPHVRCRNTVFPNR